MDRQSRIVLRERYSPRTYWLTRFVILRLLGVVYAVGFLVAINQIVPLIGSNGLLPLGTYFDQVSHSLGSGGAGFCAVALGFLALAFRYGDFNRILAWVYPFISRCSRLCECAHAGCTMVPVHVHRPCRAGLVRLRLGNTTHRNLAFLAMFLCPWWTCGPIPETARCLL